MDENYYTVDQISQMLRIHPKTIQRYIREGKLNATKIGKGWRVSGHDLSRFTEGENLSFGSKTPETPATERVKASAVIDIEVHHKDEANRIINSLTAAMHTKPPEYGRASMHSQFLEAEYKVRITLWGNLQFMSAILNALEVFTDQLGEETT
jgi:excisionase family DNA binding protein